MFFKRLFCLHDGWTQNSRYFFKNTNSLKVRTDIVYNCFGVIDKLRSVNNWMCPKCGKVKSLGFGVYLNGPINFKDPWVYQPDKSPHNENEAQPLMYHKNYLDFYR